MPPRSGVATEVPRARHEPLSRAAVAHLLQRERPMIFKSGERLAELAREWHAARARHPRIVAGVTAAFLIVATLSTVGGVWFLNGLRDGLPEYDALRRMGDMDQATAVFDDHDQMAFTLFKEQRIEVPLSQVSPNLLKAIIAIEDQRFYDHR